MDSYITRNKFKIVDQEVYRYARQLIAACGYLEGRNIVHRDIKPENILLKGGEIKLADFGLARVINNNSNNSKGKDDNNKSDNNKTDQTMKSFFTFAGTLHYMAP